MADHKTIVAWLDANATQLNLKATESTWIRDWFPGMCELTVQIEVKNKLYVGHASSDQPDKALVKASTEALERALKDNLNLPSTSGLAGHESFESACEQAKLELIERDAFFCHFLTDKKFRSIGPESITETTSAVLANVAHKLEKMGVSLKLSEMDAVNGMRAIACICLGKNANEPFGVVIGLGCKRNVEDAIKHSLLECLPNVMSILNNRTKSPLSKSAFSSLGHKSAESHFLFGLHEDSVESTLGLFDEAVDSKEQTILETKISFQEISTDCLELGEIPIKFARANSEELQKAFFGEPDEKNINFSRLQTFSGAALRFSDLNQHPHPLG